MKKLYIIALLGLLIPSISQATLYDYYSGIGKNLPSITERSVVYSEVSDEEYLGTAEQNNALESYLRGSEVLGATTKIKLTDPNSVTPYATTTPTAGKIPIADGSGKLDDGWQNITATNATDLTDGNTTTLHNHYVYGGSWERSNNTSGATEVYYTTTTVANYPSKITVYGWTGLSNDGEYPASWNNYLGGNFAGDMGPAIGLWLNGSTYGNSLNTATGVLANTTSYLIQAYNGSLYSRVSVSSVSDTSVVLKWEVKTANFSGDNDRGNIKIRYIIE